MLALAAVSVRLLSQGVLGLQAPFVTFYLAVVIAAALLGAGPAILVALCGAVGALYFFVQPLYSFKVTSAADAVWLGFYFLVCAAVIVAMEAQRRARRDSETSAKLAHDRSIQLQAETAERQRAQEAELQHRRWFETTLKSIGDAVIATDSAGRLTFLNPVAEDLTGWKTTEAADKPIHEVFVIRNEETGALAEIPVQRVLRDGRIVGLANHTILFGRDGRVTPIDDSAAPIRSSDGEIKGVVLVFRDISERRAAERAMKQSLVDMERFAYVASHDLQEPLRTVSTFATLLERRCGASLDADGREYLQFITGGVARMRHLVSDLLTYSRAGSGALRVEQVAAAEIVTDALSSLHAAVEAADANITVHDLPVIQGDRLKLAQVFQNLIGNSIKFRCHDRPCEIEVGAETREGSWVFYVRDNGMGFDEVYAGRIFEMFQRLSSAPQSGSGIGLAIAKRIVETHHGEIWAKSKLGEGATFRFSLPMASVTAAAAHANSSH